jgi:hypothetical protein
MEREDSLQCSQGPTPVSDLNHLNPIHTLTFYFLNTIFNIILIFTSVSQVVFSIRFSKLNFVCIYDFLMLATWPV